MPLTFYCFCHDSRPLTSQHLFLVIGKSDSFLIWLKLWLRADPFHHWSNTQKLQTQSFHNIAVINKKSSGERKEKVMLCQSMLCYISFKSLKNIISDMIKKNPSILSPFFLVPFPANTHTPLGNHCVYPASVYFAWIQLTWLLYFVFTISNIRRSSF